jgi:hypothetical protein
MASTLYQKLQSTDIIPMEYTSIRNIVNRFAEANNGYKVLYAMLELVHPALQTDVVMLPPKSKTVMMTSTCTLKSLMPGTGMKHMPTVHTHRVSK